MTTGRVDGSIVEEILVLLRADSHVLLAQVVHVSIDVVGVLGDDELPLPVSVPGGSYELLGQRDLVELELVHLSGSTAQQRGGCQESERLHRVIQMDERE